MKVEVKQTNDGSNTLFVPELNEHYHSVHGALQEALHVFIKLGLQPVLEKAGGPVRILEVGFGTGLNAVLTLQASLAAKQTVYYDSLEKYPLGPEVIAALHFENFILNPELFARFNQLHETPWNLETPVTPDFYLKKLHADLETCLLPPSTYDLIYFDAFAPEKQPTLWAATIFEKLASSLKTNGVLVSYCAKGSFKRTLKAAGFKVDALPGPPGKREMTKATITK